MDADRKPGLRSLVALAHVASVPESVAFYRKLGFEVAHSFTPPEADDSSWVWLGGGGRDVVVRWSAKGTHREGLALRLLAAPG